MVSELKLFSISFRLGTYFRRATPDRAGARPSIGTHRVIKSPNPGLLRRNAVYTRAERLQFKTEGSGVSYLNSGTTLNYRFGQANTVGGFPNDLTNVGGNLTLAGTINVTVPPGGTFGPGLYRVFNYSGTLTDNGLAIGTVPNSGVVVQTSVPHRVNLVNTNGLIFNYWDGAAGPKNDGVVNGGNGTWQSSSGNDNWTNAGGTINAPFFNGAFALFQATPGTVTADNSVGAVTASGMQFAVNGYTITGGALTLSGTQATIRVGDDTAAGANYTATIDSVIAGTSELVKTDLGTLVLAGANTYTGGTAINGGTVSVSSDGNLGAVSGSLSFDNGTLETLAGITSARAITLSAGGGTIDTDGFNSTFTGVVSGSGRLTIIDPATVTLSGTNTYSGGTIVNAGATVAVTSDANLGASGGAVTLDNGTLATNAGIASVRPIILNSGGGVIDTEGNTNTFGGVISGTGALTIVDGGGVMTLSGVNTYSGGTIITGGASVAITSDAGLGAPGAPLTLGDGTVGDNSTGPTTGGTLITNGTITTMRPITLGANGGTVNTNGFTSTFGGPISGSGSLTKAGVGTMILTGTNTYAGGTTIKSGALQIGNGTIPMLLLTA